MFSSLPVPDTTVFPSPNSPYQSTLLSLINSPKRLSIYTPIIYPSAEVKIAPEDSQKGKSSENDTTIINYPSREVKIASSTPVKQITDTSSVKYFDYGVVHRYGILGTDLPRFKIEKLLNDGELFNTHLNFDTLSHQFNPRKRIRGELPQFFHPNTPEGSDFESLRLTFESEGQKLLDEVFPLTKDEKIIGLYGLRLDVERSKSFYEHYNSFLKFYNVGLRNPEDHSKFIISFYTAFPNLCADTHEERYQKVQTLIKHIAHKFDHDHCKLPQYINDLSMFQITPLKSDGDSYRNQIENIQSETLKRYKELNNKNIVNPFTGKLFK